MKFAKMLVAAGIALSALGVQAQNTILGSSFSNGVNSQSFSFAGGTADFTSAPGNFKLKTVGGYTGVGITGGRTGDEIDIGETLSGSFTNSVVISQFSLGVLFDGPEFKDVNEIAQVTATWADDTTSIFTLTATDIQTASWSGSFGSVSNLSKADGGFGGVWSVINPFGNQLVKGLAFTALTGTPSSTCTNCNNQSDYTLVSVTAVPEVETYAMMLAGLGLMGTIARRRKAKQTA